MSSHISPPSAWQALHPLVIQLLEVAQQSGVDITQDQPYQPFAKTSFQEAMQHLKINSTILVQGGKLYCSNRLELHASLIGGSQVPITWTEMIALLRINYPGPARTPSGRDFCFPKMSANLIIPTPLRAEVVEEPITVPNLLTDTLNDQVEEIGEADLLPEERDTLPYSSIGTPRDGYGFCTNYPRDYDLEKIDSEEWDIVVLDSEDRVSFVGHTYIDGCKASVWFNHVEECLVAQATIC